MCVSFSSGPPKIAVVLFVSHWCFSSGIETGATVKSKYVIAQEDLELILRRQSELLGDGEAST